MDLMDHVQSRPPRGRMPIGNPCGPDHGLGVDVDNTDGVGVFMTGACKVVDPDDVGYEGWSSPIWSRITILSSLSGIQQITSSKNIHLVII